MFKIEEGNASPLKPICFKALLFRYHPKSVTLNTIAA
jgi:hypothetical protein